MDPYHFSPDPHPPIIFHCRQIRVQCCSFFCEKSRILYLYKIYICSDKRAFTNLAETMAIYVHCTKCTYSDRKEILVCSDHRAERPRERPVFFPHVLAGRGYPYEERCHFSPSPLEQFKAGGGRNDLFLSPTSRQNLSPPNEEKKEL